MSTSIGPTISDTWAWNVNTKEWDANKITKNIHEFLSISLAETRRNVTDSACVLPSISYLISLDMRQRSEDRIHFHPKTVSSSDTVLKNSFHRESGKKKKAKFWTVQGRGGNPAKGIPRKGYRDVCVWGRGEEGVHDKDVIKRWSGGSGCLKKNGTRKWEGDPGEEVLGKSGRRRPNLQEVWAKDF